MATFFKLRGRRTRNSLISKRFKTALFVSAALFGALGVIFSEAIAAEPLSNGIEVERNSDLIYYLSVREDGIDVKGIESNDTTVADVAGGRVSVTDKLPEGLSFKGFVTTDDGTIGAASRSDSSVICSGNVVDDTKEISVKEGSWNADKSEFTYHGLHYDANTRTVSFVAEKIRAGCELMVGIITTTPESVDDPATSQIETR